MNILGVGGWELLLIFIIMLMVAGPKRMAQWAYILGTYLAKFRAMWADTVDILQKELDDAGVDVKIPKDMPTRANFNQHAGRALDNITRPVKETMDQTTAELTHIKKGTAASAGTANTALRGNGHAPAKPKVARPSATSSPIQPEKPASSGTFGTWSANQDDKPQTGFGTWSTGSTKSDSAEE